MKQIYFIFLLLLNYSAFAQCEEGRYVDSLFTVEVTSGIQFGSNLQTNILGIEEPVDLLLDLYMPVEDEMTNRPMIVLAFGGAFVLGARDEYYMVDLCNYYASRGYVVASIDYRLTSQILTNATDTITYQAVAKGTHDMRAAVRFCHKEAENWGVDSSQIYVGGVSAGAFAAIHTAYLDEENEIPPLLVEYFDEWGGLEGNSGNPEYPSTVAGVINLSGAIGDTSWIKPNDVPIVSMHGTADDIVPYAYGLITIFDINLNVFGSSEIHKRCNNIGLNNDFYTYEGEGHTPFIDVPPFFPNENALENYAVTVSFVSNFMVNLVCAPPTSNQGDLNFSNIKSYPNPASNYLYITGLQNRNIDYTIIDVSGKTLQQGKLEDNFVELSNYLTPGLYLLKLSEKGLTIQTKKVIIER